MNVVHIAPSLAINIHLFAQVEEHRVQFSIDCPIPWVDDVEIELPFLVHLIFASC